MENLYNSLQMEDITDQYDPAEMEQQKGLAIVAYLFEILFFLPIMSNKDSAYAKTVANQSLTIAAASLAVYVIRIIIGKIPVCSRNISGIVVVFLVQFLVAELFIVVVELHGIHQFIHYTHFI